MSTTGPVNSLTFLDCSAVGGTGTMLDYDPFYTAIQTDLDSSSRVSETESTTASATNGSDEDGNNDDNNNDDNNDTNTDTDGDTEDGDDSDNGKSTPIGAIVGGAVGGVVILAVIGVGIFFFVRRKKSKKGVDNANLNPNNNNNTQPLMGQTHPSPGISHTSGVPSSYQGYAPVPQGQQPPYSPHNTQGGAFQQYPYPQNNQQQYPPQGWRPHGQPDQNWGAGAGAGSFSPISTTGSPPPQSNPSPMRTEDGTASSPAVELGSSVPVGNQGNRAELGGT